ncbi:hypothetical protein PG990_011740 [Apiospora arundinis]
MYASSHQHSHGSVSPVEQLLPVSPLDGTANLQSSAGRACSSYQVELSATTQPSKNEIPSTAMEDHVSYRQPVDTQSQINASNTNQPTGRESPSEISSNSDNESEKAKPVASEEKGPRAWWWWWEILAPSCMIGLVVILANIDNIPLSRWWLPIQPNSLIAVLTTLAKSSMMLTVASCISQLKWGHYSRHPRNLVDLETFDDASRGPWGSATLLWLLSFRVPILVTSGLAFVTIVSLGIDPCAQQVLEFPCLTTPLENVTAEIGTANQYFSKGMREKFPERNFVFVPNADLLHLQASIINSVVGTVFQPHVSCPPPATHCYWDEFATLGICSDFRDVSSIAEANCTKPDEEGRMTCAYNFPGKPDDTYLGSSISAVGMTWNPEKSKMKDLNDSTMLFRSSFDLGGMTHWPLFGAFAAVKALEMGHPTNSNGTDMKPPPVQMSYAEFGWCEQRYQNVTATRGGMLTDNVRRTTERLSLMESLAQSDDAGNKMGANYLSYIANSTGQVYNISGMARAMLPKLLNSLFETSVKNINYRPDFHQNTQLDLGSALLNSPLDKVTADISAALTNQIRSVDPGDNYNATTVKGKAVYDETYIRVRWPWIILPLVEITLSAVLLLASIMATSGMPLWKTSSLAFLISGRWEEDNFDNFLRERKGREKMGKEIVEEWGKGVKARLIGGDKDGAAKGGNLRFQRVLE